MKIVKQSVKLVTKTPNIGEVIEHATRQCYKSHKFVKEGSAEKLFNQVVKQHHHDSVCEHASITVDITTDRAMMAQITRHRIGTSFSIESQRYNNYSKDKFESEITVIVPENLKTNVAYEEWEEAMSNAENSYFQLIWLGCNPEVARSVLPNSCKVDITMTGNIRAWRHFFKLRAEGHAQSDIQVLCELIYKCFIDNDVPAYLFSDIFNN